MGRNRGGRKRSRSPEQEAQVAERIERRKTRREQRKNADQGLPVSQAGAGWMVVEAGGELLVHEGLEPPAGYRACTGDDGQVFVGDRNQAFAFKAALATRFKRAAERRARGGGRRGREPIQTEEPIYCVTKGPAREEFQFIVRRLDEEWPRGWYEIKKTRSLIPRVAQERADTFEQRRREKYQQQG